MTNSFEMILWIPIFVLLLITIHQTVKLAFHFEKTPSFIVSLCVTLLAILGMRQMAQGDINVLLFPYAVLAIIILTLVFIMKTVESLERRSSQQNPEKKKSSEIFDEDPRDKKSLPE